MKHRVLITGGAGFIGANLAGRLLHDGNEVTVYDDLLTGRRENLAAFRDNPDFRFIEGEVEELPDLPADRIYHLACPASPVHYRKDPIKTAKTSVLGALRVLDLASKCGARVLLSSTSEIYGNPLVHPQTESYFGNVRTTGPRACYDEGKRMAETLFMDYFRMYGTQIRIVRIFNTYGPKMRPDDGRVVSNLIMEALHGRPLTVYGDGSQTRSFCYVSDMVEGLVRMMEQDGFTGPVNLGNPAEMTVLELAEKVRALAGGKPKIIFRELPEDDPVRRRPDISLAKKMLSWEPAVSLDEGLEKTFAYFRDCVEETV
ncbi:MAG: SDR family oxidoreductase [Lachnospiraceae bacterium]|nr:SDR family oxidoreductase [Lachnospiraceae bacterium]